MVNLLKRIGNLFRREPELANYERDFADSEKDYSIKIKRDRKKFSFCKKCKIDITRPTSHFWCKYCENWHCPKHRLPEKHDCKGDPQNPHKENPYVIRYSK